MWDEVYKLYKKGSTPPINDMRGTRLGCLHFSLETAAGKCTWYLRLLFLFLIYHLLFSWFNFTIFIIILSWLWKVVKFGMCEYCLPPVAPNWDYLICYFSYVSAEEVVLCPGPLQAWQVMHLVDTLLVLTKCIGCGQFGKDTLFYQMYLSYEGHVVLEKGQLVESDR